MFYGQAGGKDLVKRKWKGLAEFVKLECDGKDLTPKLKEHKVHAIVFLNIPSYGGGTHPWNRSGGSIEPATDDGLIEVVGLTTYQLVSLYKQYLFSTIKIFIINSRAKDMGWDVYPYPIKVVDVETCQN